MLFVVKIKFDIVIYTNRAIKLKVISVYYQILVLKLLLINFSSLQSKNHYRNVANTDTLNVDYHKLLASIRLQQLHQWFSPPYWRSDTSPGSESAPCLAHYTCPDPPGSGGLHPPLVQRGIVNLRVTCKQLKYIRDYIQDAPRS